MPLPPNAKPDFPFETKYKFRGDLISAMINHNGWARGAELGVRQGKCLFKILDNCPSVIMIGVDIWKSQPNNQGPETWSHWPHDEYRAAVFEKQKEYGNRCVLIQDWSFNACDRVEDESLDFIFIDADHSTESVTQDIMDWGPKVRKGGWILGHDINWPSVRIAVENLLPNYIILTDNVWGVPKR